MTHPLSLNTHAEQIAHYKMVRDRLNRGKVPPYPKIEKTPEVYVPFIARQLPRWVLVDMHFDDHVFKWRDRASYTPRNWLRKRCAEMGLDYKEITGPSRQKVITRFRFQLIWEMKQEFTLSYPQMGRIFGGRDHTSILHAYRQWEKMRCA